MTRCLSYAITSVTMLRRSCGAVVSELMSRRPSMLMMQRARDRRGRHGQHVHGLAHLLQSLLVRDAEALLFVDDDQAQIGEFHVLADQAMRADEDVDFALGQPFHGLLLLAGRFESADGIDHERIIDHPLPERAVMLLGQHGRRHQHGDLLAKLDGFEGGAHRHFRLAVADVAAEQAIHRPGLLHVLLDLLGGDDLIRRSAHTGNSASNSRCHSVSGG